MKKGKIVKIGVVGVDSGQLMLCDPCYIANEFITPDSEGKADHAHQIYKNKDDGKLWQFTYGEQPSTENINPFPGTYGDVIPEYGMSPNDLIAKDIFVEAGIDPTAHIPAGEFSYRGACKATDTMYQGGQLNFKLGHAGAAVAFRTGLGDGVYDVYAELVLDEHFGTRVKKVWVEFM